MTGLLRTLTRKLRRAARMSLAWTPKARTRVRRSESQKGKKRKPKGANNG